MEPNITRVFNDAAPMRLESLDFFVKLKGVEVFSHWSVCEMDASGNVRDLATCVMHDTFEACEAERKELEAENP